MLGIITGILMTIFGMIAVGMPFRTFLGIGWMLGCLFILHGISVTAFSFSQKKKNLWSCVFGILVIVAGILLLANGAGRFLIDVFVCYLIGAYVAVYGAKEAYAGYKEFKEDKFINGMKIAFGVISVIAGILVIIHPLKAMFSLGMIVGISIIMQGVNITIVEYKIRKESKKNK